jgi:ketosteroid isomerase-like protein
MSRENVEIVRALYDAFNGRDLHGLLDLMAPDIELRTTVETFRGHEGVAAFIQEADRTFDGFTLTAGDVIDAGEVIVVAVHEQGHGKGSGIDINDDFTHVWTLRDAHAVSLQAFTNRPEALEAVGLAE